MKQEMLPSVVIYKHILKMLNCMSLPPATISSVPIYDATKAHKQLEDETMEECYPCCGKSICKGCCYSCCKSGNNKKCPFCNSNQSSETDYEEQVDQY